MSTLLVLTEHTLTQHDVDRIVGSHDQELQVYLVVAANPDDPPPDDVLQKCQEMLRAAGVQADGETAPHDPVATTEAAAKAKDADEVWVITEPHLVADFLRRDWATRIRNNLKLPVLHVIGGTDEVIS